MTAARKTHDSAVNAKAALYYPRQLGWSVIPLHWPTGDKEHPCSCGKRHCGNTGKHPFQWFAPNGVHSATSDLVQIADWWQRRPKLNVGVAVGPENGFFVVDLDPRNGSNESLLELEERYGQLPETVESLTGGQGRHLLYKWVPELENATFSKIADGIDILGPGKLFVAPPSLHHSGRCYNWEASSRPDSVQIAKAPGWLIDLLLQNKRKGKPDNAKSYSETVDPESFLMGYAFSKAGMLGKELEPGMFAAECPWEKEHSCGARYDTSTVVYAPGIEGGPGYLWCFHEHCRGKRSVRQVLNALPADAVAEAEAKFPREPPETEASSKDAPRAEWSTMADRLRRSQSAGPRHPTGIQPLDVHLRGGIRTEKVIVIGGAPGAGKTSLGAQMARHWARNGVAVAWVAIDEETAGIDARNLQSIGVDREKAEEPDEETVRIAEAEFGSLPLHPFDDCSVEDAFEWLAERYPDQPRAVIIDSLQTARTRTSGLVDSIRERIGHIVSTAKAYGRADKTRAIVVFTSELARGAYRSKQTSDRIEDLAAFKESGAIEYQGHVLLVLRTVKGDAALTHVSLPKNRTGTKGEFGLRFDFETATFTPEELPEEDAGVNMQEFDALCDRVFEVVKANPGISGRRARIEVGAKGTTVYAALERLEANGAIRNTAKGRAAARWTVVFRPVGTDEEDQGDE